jgi:CRP-like cAMP-binding protein
MVRFGGSPARCVSTGPFKANSEGDITQGGYMTLERALQGNDFGCGLDESQLAKLTSLGQEVRFEENDLILIAGERSKAFFVLLTGSAWVEVAADFCSVRIQAVSPGEVFGWSSLLDCHDTLFQVRARERSSALCFDGPAVSALCREHPELGVKLLQRVLQTVAGRIHGLESSLALFCGLSADGKCAAQA